MYQFRKEKQETGESLDTYRTRLRRLAATCEFADTDREIKTQIVQNCTSSRLRRRALPDASISLTEMLDDGRAMELTEKQASGMETSGETPREAEVNIASERFKKKKTQHKRFNNTASKNTGNRQKSTTCYYCGEKYPHPPTKQCAAKGKT